MASLPLGSAGSGGSGGGIWGVGPMPTAPPGPNPQTHDVWTGGQTSGSTTTYGPIYNPAAPPPSATYFNGAWGGVAPPPHAGSSHSGGSGSHRGGSNRLILAGSGSGSESASDGRSSSIMGSDKSSLIRNQGLRPGKYSIRFDPKFSKKYHISIFLLPNYYENLSDFLIQNCFFESFPK